MPCVGVVISAPRLASAFKSVFCKVPFQKCILSSVLLNVYFLNIFLVNAMRSGGDPSF